VPKQGENGGNMPAPLSPPTYVGYGPSQNQGETDDLKRATGLFTRQGIKVRFANVSDGLSNTIMIGETLPEQQSDAKQQEGGGGWAMSGGGYSVGTTIIPINYVSDFDDGSQCNNPQRNINNWNVSFGFKSHHSGGAMFVFGDGSVHYLNQNINHQTYQYLGCRNDGQVPGDY
jgi:prepilin-type processing-associated H-X9-DG protein